MRTQFSKRTLTSLLKNFRLIMEKNGEIAITQMRELVEKKGSSSTEKHGDSTLLRFLVARSMNPEKAAQMFLEWEKWRAGIAPSGNVDEAEIADELNCRKAFLQGPTKDGYGLSILQACKHFPPKDQLQYKKFVTYMLDKTIARDFSSIKEKESGNEKMISIIDLQNLGLKNLDAQGFLTGFQFIQSYYPERLAKLYILSMPWIFLGVWKMVSAFLDKAILEKVAIVKTEKERRAMIEEIGEDGLPKEYGGLDKLTLIQDVKLNR